MTTKSYQQFSAMGPDPTESLKMDFVPMLTPSMDEDDAASSLQPVVA